MSRTDSTATFSLTNYSHSSTGNHKPNERTSSGAKAHPATALLHRELLKTHISALTSQLTPVSLRITFPGTFSQTTDRRTFPHYHSQTRSSDWTLLTPTATRRIPPSSSKPHTASTATTVTSIVPPKSADR